jgi:hypothetical protein
MSHLHRIAVLFFVPIFGFASTPVLPLRVDTPPVIDGRLDDTIWRDAPFVTGFRTFIPDFGKTMPESTIVYMAHDRQNLYFAFRCFDPDPSTIKAEITSRDNIRPNDWICINLDSFNDQQALYGFYVNPLGIQADSRFAGGSEDHSVDLIWYSAGQIDDEGYIIEIQIPLKSLRYASRSPVTMGVIFERRVSRRSEQATYPPLDPKQGFSFTTQMMPIQYYDLEPWSLFEILPAVTYGQRYQSQAGRLSLAERRGDLSLTAKYGITSDLILDATYNPDFSQVEADAGQVDVNLRYGLFFPEKRPFFLEGKESFNFAASASLFQVVHTRTIVNPLVGAKLTGKIGSDGTIASIYAVDELLQPEPGRSGSRAHFPILRYKHAIGDDSFVGGILTGRMLGKSYNRVSGLDGFLRLTPSSSLEFHGLATFTQHTDISKERQGFSLAALYLYGTRDLDYSLEASRISGDFTAEAGYVTRTGVLNLGGFVKPKFYPSSSFIRRVDLTVQSLQTRDEFSRLWETLNVLSVNHVLKGALSARVQYFYSTEVFLAQRFKTDGFQISGGGQFTRHISTSLLHRRTNAIFYSAAPFQGRSSRWTLSLVLQPINQIEANYTLTYVSFHRSSDNLKIYEYPISRLRLTYQLNRYLFLRGIAEYNKFRRTLLSDYLLSFTYIPGTVMHAGYGSLHQRVRWDGTAYAQHDEFHEMRRGFFFKMSYLWRM